MKRIVAIIILLLIVLLTPVYAMSSDSHDVVVGSVDSEVYHVGITWGEMKFTYREEEIFSWTNHEYNREGSKYSWTSKGNSINISNDSYFKVNVKCKYNSYNNSITGKFSSSDVDIKSKGKEQIKFDLSGSLFKGITRFTEVGKITLEIE